jgi:hypothetical protein
VFDRIIISSRPSALSAGGLQVVLLAAANFIGAYRIIFKLGPPLFETFLALIPSTRPTTWSLSLKALLRGRTRSLAPDADLELSSRTLAPLWIRLLMLAPAIPLLGGVDDRSKVCTSVMMTTLSVPSVLGSVPLVRRPRTFRRRGPFGRS